jgi:rhodanese-related sulfurtransferase
MEQLFQFVGNHPFLFFAFGTVGGLLIWSFFGEQLQGIQSVQPQEATLLINHEDAIVLDVREDSEFVQGHIINSLHIPLSGLSDKIKRLEKYRDRPIILSCASGSRSATAYHRLKKLGFEKVYNLRGGLMAWQSASFPLAKGKEG